MQSKVKPNRFGTMHPADRKIGVRVAQIWAAVTLTALIPATGHAALSDWIINIGNEFALAVPIIIAILAGVGIAMAGFGILSWVSAKKNQREPTFQMYVIIGGVLLILLIPFVAAVGESVSGEDTEKAIESVI
ncbi:MULTISPECIES: hypothetical protein [Marinobacter]|uniref:Uncharacterized protein n=1 Tax=Marinobacter nauticus (strain ATCC 700491 / DSM 11845 / VT8) TaxID=351348 RepID=A1U7S8_MARN8|nr:MULTISPECIES: hypothetical protein [Marinobacter]ABM21047.1 hypothetical protein Maqu_4196 [Marinobacter nauticus VT8]|tara:strand:+ start:314 stop:712 length:399 start_codon:yes stop_codon:yes gene_type:complete